MKQLRSVPALVLMLGLAQPLWADPITIVNDDRRTLTRAFVFTGDTPAGGDDVDERSDVLGSTAAATMGADSASAAATLTTSFADPMHWFGRGTTAGFVSTASRGHFDAISTFSIAFELTAPMAYHFDGTFEASSAATGGERNLAMARFAVRDVSW